MYSACRSVPRVILILASATLAFSGCAAQEVASLDLTKIAARVDLVRPKATSETSGGYSGVQYTSPCFDSTLKKGVLHTSLVSLDRTYYQVGDEPTFEVTLQNTGSVPIRIPFSPHLADLQPKNPAQKFAYYELQIALWIGANDHWSTNMGGSAILYGADDHANTMLTLKPGEWVQVVAKGHFDLDDDLLKLTRSAFPADHAYAQTALFREETLITARHSATVAHEVCVEQTHGQNVAMQLTIR